MQIIDDTIMEQEIIGFPETHDTDLSDEALDRTPGKGQACWHITVGPER